MAWLEGLSTLKGQITSFTKEVLSDGRDEIHDTSSELSASKKKIEELEALCTSQDLEITELRQRNAELERRLIAGGATSITRTLFVVKPHLRPYLPRYESATPEISERAECRRLAC